jgi:hypothetical protein
MGHATGCHKCRQLGRSGLNAELNNAELSGLSSGSVFSTGGCVIVPNGSPCFRGAKHAAGEFRTQVNDLFQQSAALIREWQPGTVLYTLRGPRMAARALRLRQQLEHMGIVRGHFMTHDRVPDNVRHACNPAVLWPLGADDMPRAVAMRVQQQNLQPLMAMHELPGGFLVAGSPLHLAAGQANPAASLSNVQGNL